MANLYNTDFYEWSLDRTAKLRKLLAERPDLDVDFENIADESLGKRDALVPGRRLAEFDAALMKLAFPFAREPRRHRELIVRGQRHAIEQVLQDSPSLRDLLRGQLQGAHEYALIQFDNEALIRLTMSEPPVTCPFDLDDMLNPGWWPEPRGTDRWQ